MYAHGSSYSYENHSIRRGGTKFVLNLAEEINDMTLALESIQVSLNSLLRVFMIDIIALDSLLISHGKVCAIANTSCHTQINVLGQGEVNTETVPRKQPK